VLRGKIYCSPACGFDCLKKDYDLAVARADKAVKELGPGWKPVVWENCGWRARVEKGKCSIYLFSGKLTRCWAATEVGPDGQQFECADTTPKKTLRKLKQLMAETSRDLKSQIQSL